MVLAKRLWSWQDHCGPGKTTILQAGPLWSCQDHCGPGRTTRVLITPFCSCRVTIGNYGPTRTTTGKLWSGQDHNWQLWSGQDHNWQLWSGQDHNWQVVVRPGPQVPKKLKHKRAWSCTLLLVCFRPAHTYFGTILDLCTLLLGELVMLQQLWSGQDHNCHLWSGLAIVVRPGPQLAIIASCGPTKRPRPSLLIVARPRPT